LAVILSERSESKGPTREESLRNDLILSGLVILSERSESKEIK
jgi:hypothetical protein